VPSGTQLLDATGQRRVPCQTRLAPGAPGVVQTIHVPAATEALTATAGAAAGTDWDLAVFDRATGALLGASAYPRTRDTVTAVLEPAQAVVVQACRRRGPAVPVALGVTAQPVPPATVTDRTGAQLVEVAIDGEEDLHRLEALGVDVSHDVEPGRATAVVTGDEQRRAVQDAGFTLRVVVPDLVAAERARAAAPAVTTRALPSGRTTYRTPADYSTDLKTLVETYPGHVRRADLPVKSLEGRPIEAVEIAADVGRPTDGRPIFLLSGLTHAREWPGGEMAMEFALDLAKGFGTDATITDLLQRVRVVVVPVANPDGFAVSRGAADALAAGDDRPDTVTLAQIVNDQGAYKRKNCRALTPETQSVPCALRAPFGVDLNRAYSAYWGGDGSSPDPNTQQYRGPAPFTEPEAQAVRAFAVANQVQVFITNHTFTVDGRILRQPGFDIPGDEVQPTVPDEARLAALGEEMAQATAGISELGYASLGNITGPADDFLYYAQGTYGYTPELRGENFHTGYANAVVAEYEGSAARGTAGRGWREAYLDAMAYAANPADHLVLQGTAPPGAVLRLQKDFMLPLSTDQDGDGTDDVPAGFSAERIDTTLTVPADGRFTWSVNPSKRPYGPAEEAYRLTCRSGDAAPTAPREVRGARGETLTFDLADCVAPPAPPAPPVAPAAGGSPAPGPSSPGGTPTATPRRLALAIHRPAFSASRANRRRTVAIRIGLRGGTLRDVTVRALQGRRTVLRGRTAALRSNRTLAARRLARLRPGTVEVVLTARDAAGKPVRLAERVRVTR
jgi:hypothetical protein